MNWDELLERDDLVGGDIETHEGGDVYRGPIKEITNNGGTVTVMADWIATMPADLSGTWKPGPVNSISFNSRECPIQSVEHGRAIFMIPGMGVSIIFFKGGSKLDPAKVEGLKLPDQATERSV
jgi:hypothetical protein